LQGMINCGIRDIVFSSSCTVYGQPALLPAREDTPIQKANSPYGNTKQISEEIITETSVNENIRAILLRYFNPIGAHESALIGELPLGVPNNLMPYITQTAIGKRDFLRVWGNDYNTPDGTAIRDYIHVVDLAKAHVIAVERMINDKGRDKVEIFNLGTGNGFSVMEVIRSFERSTGTKLNYKIMERRPGDVEQVWADTTFANDELGWRAERTLDEMTLSAWNWEKALAARSEHDRKQ
ncbi:MAG TPA: UDP-glucose 4-epimerase GalE, partial [Bacteroidales bacterium]|nr:UDP-glucose 4-epimerase GalE [Bacteroidales bacterium]